MRNAITNLFTFRWNPGQDTAVAILTALLMIPVYYVGTHWHNSVAGMLIFVIFGNGLLNVLLPAYYLLVFRRVGLEEFGITTHRLWLAVPLSLVCTLFVWKGLQREAQLHSDIELLPQLIFNGVILWEPFFVFGWLQLRFERAFGMLPGILLAAICFGVYHLGTYPMNSIITLVIVGILSGILFRTTKNLLTLWPATWAVMSSIGTMQADMQFGWDQVAIYAAILVVQVIAIGWMARRGAEKGTEKGDILLFAVK